MNSDNNYIEQTEPNDRIRSYNWKTAIGLQDVDGLKPSEYLIDVANRNISGDISLYEAERRIFEYYENKPTSTEEEKQSEEADKVSLHITQALASDAFRLAPPELLAIHRQLFAGVFDHAGRTRDCNISKKEWVLNGKSVVYADFHTVKDAFEYDISKEKEFDYSALDERKTIEHIAGFIADLWQIHGFREGNTRTIAVFAIKYLRTFGYDITNDTFEKHAWYFRNALVRANYNDRKNGITATPVYLNRFFGNLLLNDNNELKNRELQITQEGEKTK